MNKEEIEQLTKDLEPAQADAFASEFDKEFVIGLITLFSSIYSNDNTSERQRAM